MSMLLFLLPTLLLAAVAAAELECPNKCGNVDIPYPFGISAVCSRSKGFEISCVNNGSTAVLGSATHEIPVMSLSVAPQPLAKVMLPVAYKCYSSAGNRVIAFDGGHHVDLNIQGVHYRISKVTNMFTVLRWKTGAYGDMNSDGNSSMPVWLDWAIRDDNAPSCAAAKNSTGYACVSAGSECVDSINGPGYFCRCKQGFVGNPYKERNGCTRVDVAGYKNKTGSTMMQSLPQLWKEWEIRLMVLLSFILQLFLLLAGSVHRRKVNGLHRVSLWLAYVGADAVAVFALGLISHYGENCGKLGIGNRSFGDTQPFLWIPFLLVHLGGQDSITAYSIEDNNLWLRHLLNLGIQGALALYIIWKSIYIFDPQILIPTACMFLSGIIKYGERIWALKSASRGDLAKAKLQPDGQNNYNPPTGNSNIYSYALQTVLHSRGLFVGRTLLQLGHETLEGFVDGFEAFPESQVKLKIIEMKLGLMFDLLYTKATVLQSWAGWLFRLAAQLSMGVAFLLFHIRVVNASSNSFLMKSEMDIVNHDWVNIMISYALFIGAICMEACSVAMVITSLWTRGHLREGTFLHWLCISNACSKFMTAEYDKMMGWLSSDTIGQLNYIDYIIRLPRYKLLCKAINAFGLVEHWINLRYVKHTETATILRYIEEQINTPWEIQWRLLHVRRLYHTLNLPFEHVIYRLHIFTDLFLTKRCGDRAEQGSGDVIDQLKEDCQKLSNYMFYLSEMHPSMLPVSVGVSSVNKPVYERENEENRPRLQVVQDHANNLRSEQDEADCPFILEGKTNKDLILSLENIRAIWIRLLLYAAGKCGGELHARQLGNGGELLSFVWLLMLHRNLGDAAREYKLLLSAGDLPVPGFLVAAEGNDWVQRLDQPLYAFDFRQAIDKQEQSDGRVQFQQIIETRLSVASNALGIRGIIRVSTVPPKRDEAGTSREAERDQAETEQDISNAVEDINGQAI